MDWTIWTVLPLLGLGVLGAVVPVLLARAVADTLGGVALATAASAVVLATVGAALFVGLYARGGLTSEALGRPGAAAHFAALGLQSALVWGPILALRAIGMAQAVEARRGQRMAARTTPQGRADGRGGRDGWQDG